jgi:hypothetical protein
MLDHRHRAQPVFAWVVGQGRTRLYGEGETEHPRLPGGRQAMPIGLPLPTAELQLFPTTGTS